MRISRKLVGSPPVDRVSWGRVIRRLPLSALGEFAFSTWAMRETQSVLLIVIIFACCVGCSYAKRAQPGLSTSKEGVLSIELVIPEVDDGAESFDATLFVQNHAGASLSLEYYPVGFTIWDTAGDILAERPGAMVLDGEDENCATNPKLHHLDFDANNRRSILLRLPIPNSRAEKVEVVMTLMNCGDRKIEMLSAEAT
ncbi:MAG: hypothetical protein AAFQ65_15070, partial [Myxococcota bacterium]